MARRLLRHGSHGGDRDRNNCEPTPASCRQTLDPPFSVHVLIVDAGTRQLMLEKPNKDGPAMIRILRYALRLVLDWLRKKI